MQIQHIRNGAAAFTPGAAAGEEFDGLAVSHRAERLALNVGLYLQHDRSPQRPFCPLQAWSILPHCSVPRSKDRGGTTFAGLDFADTKVQGPLRFGLLK